MLFTPPGGSALPRIDTIDGLVLILTPQCNLRCSYCYQNAKSQQSMSWETARGAVDVLLRSRRNHVQLDFWGGEPLLEYDLIRRLVVHVESHKRPDMDVIYGISSNGVLIDDAVIQFLDAFGFNVQISFDGVPAAQESRGRGTFEKLDHLLATWRRDYPRSWPSLTLAVTLHPDNLEALPESIDYYFSRDVRELNLAPVFTHDPGWQVDDIHRLDAVFRCMWERSAHHFESTGHIPIKHFREITTPDRGSESRAMCGVMKGTKPVVDVTGDVHGCVTFIESYQSQPGEFLRERVESLRLGHLADPGFPGRLAAYPQAVERTELFHRKEEKYSSYGRCGECAQLDRCSVCPMSIGNIPGNTDPRRVSDFPCAFNLVAATYAGRLEPTREDYLLGDAMRRRKAEFLTRLGHE